MRANESQITRIDSDRNLHKVLANHLSKLQVITKMGLRKAVDRSVLQDEGYTQPYITIGACYRGMFHKRMVKAYASQSTHLVVVAN
jgi:hypothetical protein